jgi:hypothetical protein
MISPTKINLIPPWTQGMDAFLIPADSRSFPCKIFWMKMRQHLKPNPGSKTRFRRFLYRPALRQQAHLLLMPTGPFKIRYWSFYL